MMSAFVDFGTSHEQLRGQLAADQLLLDLETKPPHGNELHAIIEAHMKAASHESASFMLGFARRIQKSLEQKVGVSHAR